MDNDVMETTNKRPREIEDTSETNKRQKIANFNDDETAVVQPKYPKTKGVPFHEILQSLSKEQLETVQEEMKKWPGAKESFLKIFDILLHSQQPPVTTVSLNKKVPEKNLEKPMLQSKASSEALLTLKLLNFTLPRKKQHLKFFATHFEIDDRPPNVVFKQILIVELPDKQKQTFCFVLLPQKKPIKGKGKRISARRCYRISNIGAHEC